MQALVIGGGVSGLTTALVLLERGWKVRVAAREWAPDIVSSVAAAIWHPYQVSHPDAARWAGRSIERFRRLMAREACGIRLVEGRELNRTPQPRPAWASMAAHFRTLDPEQVPEGFAGGWTYQVPVIETPLYMRWLQEEVVRRGAQLEQEEISSLEAAVARWPIVINCTGLAARELAGDETLVPIRGQIVRVAPGRLEERFLFDEEDASHPTYLIPRRDGVIVGGTTLRGDWDRTPRPDTTAEILARARRLAPELEQAEILDVLVGLRPGRPTVRLERQPLGSGIVVHNYGHGGAGFTLSWGCAEEVARLIEG